MPRRYLAVGIFIIAGTALFALGIFLVGSRHEAFAHHVLLYTEFANLDGVTKGSKVQVAGMDAGQVTKIDVPKSPNGRFRVQINVALDGTKVAMGNANDLLVGLKEGRGPAGMLLRDEKVADQIRETLSTVQSTTSNLKQASAGVSSIVADVQQRQFPQKLDDTMTQIHSASTQANETIG